MHKYRELCLNKSVFNWTFCQFPKWKTQLHVKKTVGIMCFLNTAERFKQSQSLKLQHFKKRGLCTFSELPSIGLSLKYIKMCCSIIYSHKRIYDTSIELTFKFIWQEGVSIPQPGKSIWRGRLSTVDLLVLTCLNHLIFKLKILFTFQQNKLPW